MTEPSLPEESLFAQALEIETPAERAAFLDRACANNPALRAEVEALLRAHERSGDLLDLADKPQPTTDLPAREHPGTVIGPYKLLEQIGEGGMGTVWMAEQTEPIRRRVAVKVVKEGMDTRQVLARFEAERQALALMDHPNIARVLDAGKTPSGRPYFVMELVKGKPITQYADEKRMGVRERLELFGDVCRAVQHAHQKGIIHRDLKPSNVLVAPYDGKPVVKVIDFGVAKATGQSLTDKTLFTGFGALVGTPEYMSPEQAEVNNQDIDTRSDVYALGVLLYELLTGTTPLTRKRVKEAVILELLRVIREEEPPRPSTRLSESKESLPSISAQRQTEPAKLTKLVRGELDWIVMKALEKDRNRRYETANGFAQDIQRYLADEPVQACPPSTWYRIRKFSRRNKASLAVTGLVLFFVTVLAATIGWNLRDRAARNAAIDAEANLALKEAEQLQEHGKWREALAAAKRAQGFLASGGGTDAVREHVRDRLADLEMIVRLDAIPALMALKAVTGAQFDYSVGDVAYAQAFRDYGIDVEALEVREAEQRLHARGIRSELATALEDWARARRQVCKSDDASWKHLLALAQATDPQSWRKELWDVLEPNDGEINRLRLEALARSDKALTLPPVALHKLARDLWDADARDEATTLLMRAWQRHPGDYRINQDLAELLRGSDMNAALRFSTAAVALQPTRTGAHVTIGELLEGRHLLDEAIAAYTEAARLNKDVELPYLKLGRALSAKGDLEGAIAVYRKLIELMPKGGHYYLLAEALRAKGDLAGAIAAYHSAIKDRPKDSIYYSSLGVALLRLKGDTANDPVAACREALELYPTMPAAHIALGQALQNKSDRVGAIAAFQRAIELDSEPAMAYICLAKALAQTNNAGKEDLAAALAAYSKAIELNPKNSNFWCDRGYLYRRLGRRDNALADFTKVIKLNRSDPLALSGRGEIYGEMGQWSKAIADYNMAMKYGHSMPGLWLRRGQAYRNVGQWEHAVADYGRAIYFSPQPPWENELAWLLATCPDAKIRNPQRAVELARKVVDKVPREGTFWNTLGVAIYRAGDWKAAAAAFDKSMELRAGGDAFDWFFLAMAHWKLGDHAEARKRYDQAVQWVEKNGPALAKNPQAAEELGRFRSEAEEVLELKKK
jgi:serine/threonine protein kinase/Flp pilus assembly protein TadD